MFLAAFAADCRFGVRNLLRNPGFAAAAVLTLALGIGANTAIFSVIDDALLRPLPVTKPRQLVAVYSYDTKTSKYLSTSYPDYQSFVRGSKSFQNLSAYVRVELNLSIGDHTDHVPVEAVTPGYFSTLDLAPLTGRKFLAGDNVSAGVPNALISENLWRARFQGSHAVIGRGILIENHPFTVIGIVPARYRGVNLNWSDPPRIWIPLNSIELVLPRFRQLGVLRSRNMRFLLTLGRLRPDITVSRAQAELQVLAANLAVADPSSNRHISALAFSASHSKFWPAYRSKITRAVSLFAVAAGLLLLLACTNVSNLLLGRAIGRRREISIRLAVGASRARLLRQLLTENSLLTLGSFLLSLAVARCLQAVLLHFPTAFGLPLALNLNIEPRIFFFCLALSLVTTVLFGLAPALQTTQPDIVPVLKESAGNAATSGHFLLRSSLIVVQVAFSMILLVGGGLFVRSLLKAYAIDAGFRSGGLLTMSFDLTGQQYSEQRRTVFLQHALQQISAIPGIESATVAYNPPLGGIPAAVQVATLDNKSQLSIDHNIVGPGFLRTLGIALLRGREFTPRDDANSPKVAIVNETMARRLWPNADPVGRTILVGANTSGQLAYTVVGMAHDSKYNSVWEQAQPYFYLAAFQSPFPETNLLLRTRPGSAPVLTALRERWDALAPHVPLFGIRTGEELIETSLAPQRLAAFLLASFSGLALILATIGLYSVTAHAVAQRTRDIGIRIAVGARPAEVVLQVIADTFKLVVVGLVLGMATSFVVMRFAATNANGVSSHDLATYLAVILLLATVSLFAVLVPALRAARIDPVAALKWE